MIKAKIKKGDTVLVTAGRDRGKTGKVLRVAPGERQVWVERLNVSKRHQKPRGPQSPGGIVEKESPIDVSSIRLVCQRCNKPARVGRRRLEDGRGVRVCRRCGEIVDA